MSESKKKTKKDPKRGYQRPAIKKFGSVHDLTQTLSSGSKDGGSIPNNGNMTMCASASPEIVEQRALIEDQKVQLAFQKAIAGTVKPGDVVIDLGCGNGLHTLFALQTGAKKVYAIEIGGFIHFAREVIERNGYGDRVEFIQGHSRTVSLPEKADVIVSNIGFMLGLKHLPDAYARFLKPGGKMIPSAVQIGLLPYMDESFFKQTVEFWDGKHYGFDFHDLKKLATNHPHYRRLTSEGMLTSGALSPRLEFSNRELGKVHFDQQQIATRAGTMHALGGWYQFTNGNEVMMSTRPPCDLHPEIWTNFLLPLDTPIAVSKGDRLKFEVEFDIHLLAESIFWSWSVIVNDKEKARQSTFETISPA